MTGSRGGGGSAGEDVLSEEGDDEQQRKASRHKEVLTRLSNASRRAARMSLVARALEGGPEMAGKSPEETAEIVAWAKYEEEQCSLDYTRWVQARASAPFSARRRGSMQRRGSSSSTTLSDAGGGSGGGSPKVVSSTRGGGRRIPAHLRASRAQLQVRRVGG